MSLLGDFLYPSNPDRRKEVNQLQRDAVAIESQTNALIPSYNEKVEILGKLIPNNAILSSIALGAREDKKTQSTHIYEVPAHSQQKILSFAEGIAISAGSTSGGTALARSVVACFRANEGPALGCRLLAFSGTIIVATVAIECIISAIDGAEERSYLEKKIAELRETKRHLEEDCEKLNKGIDRLRNSIVLEVAYFNQLQGVLFAIAQLKPEIYGSDEFEQVIQDQKIWITSLARYQNVRDQFQSKWGALFEQKKEPTPAQVNDLVLTLVKQKILKDVDEGEHFYQIFRKIATLKPDANAAPEHRPKKLAFKKEVVSHDLSISALVNQDDKRTIQPNEWMRYIRDSALLSEISIPGSYDSAACQSRGRFQYQDLSIRQQLEAGVRFLDIVLRYEIFNGVGRLVCHENINHTELTFVEVCEECYRFLDAHPSETILMLVRGELTDNVDSIADYINRVLDSKRHFWLNRNSCAPQLEQCRGKMVLYAQYTRNSLQNYGQDQSAIDTTDEADEDRGEWMKFEKRLAQAGSFAPSDYYLRKLHVTYLDTNTKSKLSTLNNEFLDAIASNLLDGITLGVVVSSFMNSTLCSAIIYSNFLGYENIVRWIDYRMPEGRRCMAVVTERAYQSMGDDMHARLGNVNLVSYHENTFDISFAYKSRNSELWGCFYDGNNRDRFRPAKFRIGNALSAEPPSIIRNDKHLYVAYKSNNSNDIWITACDISKLANWPKSRENYSQEAIHYKIPNQTTPAAPSLARFKQSTFLAYLANDDTRAIWITKSDDLKSWSNPKKVGGQTTTAAPTLASFNERLFLAYRANEEKKFVWITSSRDGITWDHCYKLPECETDLAPVLGTYENRLFIGFIYANRTLCKIMSSADGVLWENEEVLPQVFSEI